MPTWADLLAALRAVGYAGAETVEAVLAFVSGYETFEMPASITEAGETVPDSVRTAEPNERGLIELSIADAEIVIKAIWTASNKKTAKTSKKGILSLPGADRPSLIARIEQLESEADLVGTKAEKRGTKMHHPVHVHDRVEDDPMRGFKSPRDFLRAVLVAGRHTPEVAFKQYPGLKCQVIPEAMRTKAAGSDEQAEIFDPFGGFLLPETMAPDLLRTEPEPDVIGPRAMNVPMETPTVRFRARVDRDHSTSVSGGLTVSRRTETAPITSSRMEFEQIVLQATGLFGLSFVSEELLADSPLSLAAILAQGFQDEFTSKGIDEWLNGTGVGEPLGVLNSAALIAIAKESGQLADTILYENVVKMRARSWGYQNAIWMANHDTYPQLSQMHLAVTTSGAPNPVYQSSLREDRPDLLLGRPIFYQEAMETLGDEGDLGLFNFTQYLVGTLQAMQSAESVHVRFVNHERTFKFWVRNDGKPWWKSALTPKKGATMSPFVTLAVRA